MDWCLTCGHEVSANHTERHDIVCRPVNGWQSCDCSVCDRVRFQQEQQRG